MSNIPIIFWPFKVTVGNCSAAPNVKVVVLIVADIALRVFFNKNLSASPPLVVYIVISVGSAEDDTEKSIES
jgi:hypothetical protein